MEPFTIITTYYNDKQLLEEFIYDFNIINQKHQHLKLIVIDDGSTINPADQFCKKQDNFELYKITKDLGFNSHGARNLGVVQSTTDWNLLIDVDYDLKTLDLSQLPEVLDLNTIYFFSVNTFLIHRDAFMSCKGYDEDFVNIHFGDRLFTWHLKRRFNHVDLKGPKGKRIGWKVIVTDKVRLTTYRDGKMYHPTSAYKLKYNIQKVVDSRYFDDDFETKVILNFPWIKVF